MRRTASVCLAALALSVLTGCASPLARHLDELAASARDRVAATRGVRPSAAVVLIAPGRPLFPGSGRDDFALYGLDGSIRVVDHPLVNEIYHQGRDAAADQLVEEYLVHEFVHELQQRRKPLTPSTDLERDDRSWALSAAREGEALLTEEVAFGRDPEAGRKRFAKRPRSWKEWRYSEGLRFAIARYRQGGWASVAAGSDAPPASSAELLFGAGARFSWLDFSGTAESAIGLPCEVRSLETGIAALIELSRAGDVAWARRALGSATGVVKLSFGGVPARGAASAAILRIRDPGRAEAIAQAAAESAAAPGGWRVAPWLVRHGRFVGLELGAEGAGARTRLSTAERVAIERCLGRLEAEDVLLGRPVPAG